MPQICTLNVLVKYVFMFLFCFMSNLKLDVFVYRGLHRHTCSEPRLQRYFPSHYLLSRLCCMVPAVFFGFTAAIVNSHWPLDLPCMDPVL